MFFRESKRVKRAHESNESIAKANSKVALSISKHSKQFSEGEFVKNCVLKLQNTFTPKRKRTWPTFASLEIL